MLRSDIYLTVVVELNPTIPRSDKSPGCNSHNYVPLSGRADNMMQQVSGVAIAQRGRNFYHKVNFVLVNCWWTSHSSAHASLYVKQHRAESY